jgi:CDP-diacylglycerol--glycerol-3-phosphate 3-phosphatidyltransferase
MLGLSARPVVEKVIAPLVARLARAGVTADAVTIVGFLGALAGAVLLIARGEFFWGMVVVTASVLLDLLDGAIARARGGGSVFGAVLDSTLDRASDAAIFAALVWWFAGAGDNQLLLLLALLALILGVLTSYVKARAEGVGIPCDVGIVERLERLLLVLFGIGLAGLGVPFALHVALWLLVVGSAVTVGQRIIAVRRGAAARPLAAPTSPPS